MTELLTNTELHNRMHLVVSSCNTRKKADGEVLRLSVTAGGETRSEAGMWTHDSLSLRAYWTQSRFLFFCCWQKLREDDLTQNNHSQSDLDATMAQKQHQTDLLFIKVIGSSVFNNDIRPFHKACHKPVFVRWTACWLWRNIFLIFPKWESLEMINSRRRTRHHLIKLLPHKATSAATIKTKTFGLNSRFKDDKDKIKTSKETLWFDLIWFVI